MQASPEWIAARRGPDGIMEAAEPMRWQPNDWTQVPAILEVVMSAAFEEATVWGAELDVTINPAPQPGVELDFVAIDLDGRFPWHACNATFMTPSGDIAPQVEDDLRARGWQGVGTGGPIYRVWDDVPLVDVARQIAAATLSAFDPSKHGYWELSVTVLRAEDDTETSYEVAASATRAVLQRAMLQRVGSDTTTSPEDVAPGWDQVCVDLGFSTTDIPSVQSLATPG